MLARVDKNLLKSGKHKFKIRYFPVARPDDMSDYMKPLIRKLPNYIIWHIGTNNALENKSTEVLDKILKRKKYKQEELPKHEITVSTPVKRHDHGEASLTISHLSNKLKN